jgi:N utilization substance protein A
MDSINLVESFAEFKEFKNINRPTMMRILEEVFRNTLLKTYGTDDNFDIIVNVDKGDLEIWRFREVVEDGEVEDDNREIAYSDAIKIEPDFEVGEEVSEEVKLTDFGRREVLTIRQNLVAKIQEFERDNEFKKYKDRIGDIVSGEVYQIWKKEILILDDEGIELILPKTEQIPSDFFRKGDNIRAIVLKIETRNNNPVIILSRTSPIFLERLFEMEVPEIFDGLITIKNIVREPGERAKVAVESYDDRIDPVGACVGMKGVRIQNIVKELNNEKIDIINYSSEPDIYIARALTPVKPIKILSNPEDKIAVAIIEDDKMSLAIGKGGQNLRLASRLTGYQIEPIKESEYTTESEETYISLEDIEELPAALKNKLIDADVLDVKEVLDLGQEGLLEISGIGEKSSLVILDIVKKYINEDE